MNHFKIIVPFYNTERWIKNTIDSIKKQKYKNFECIIINDLSTDRSREIVLEEIKNNNNFKFIDNQEKKYALRNIYDGIKQLNPSAEDIIVTLDGDDWFFDDNTLDILDKYYQGDILMTYGSYIEYPSNFRGQYSKKLPEQIIKNNLFRESPWMTSHLRTFKYKLWKNININDLKDENKNFFKTAWDLSFMLPMLEMSGDKSKFIEEILYVYNLQNDLNDHKINANLQQKTENYIRKLKKYRPLGTDNES